jgi:hypothetical protein
MKYSNLSHFDSLRNALNISSSWIYPPGFTMLGQSLSADKVLASISKLTKQVVRHVCRIKVAKNDQSINLSLPCRRHARDTDSSSRRVLDAWFRSIDRIDVPDKHRESINSLGNFRSLSVSSWLPLFLSSSSFNSDFSSFTLNSITHRYHLKSSQPKRTNVVS